MMASPIRHVKRSRKAYICDWCNRRIAAGQPYATWFTYEENVISRMHPECCEAMQRADRYDEELPPRGTYRRGCWCGESEQFCTCKAETINNSKGTDNG